MSRVKCKFYKEHLQSKLFKYIRKNAKISIYFNKLLTTLLSSLRYHIIRVTFFTIRLRQMQRCVYKTDTCSRCYVVSACDRYLLIYICCYMYYPLYKNRCPKSLHIYESRRFNRGIAPIKNHRGNDTSRWFTFINFRRHAFSPYTPRYFFLSQHNVQSQHRVLFVKIARIKRQSEIVGYSSRSGISMFLSDISSLFKVHGTANERCARK